MPPIFAEAVVSQPTALSGLTVAIQRRAVISGVTVAPPAKCLGARKPPSPDVPPPKVVSSYPKPGAVVRPGLLVLRVTFDLPMSCDGMLRTASPWRNPCPGADREFLLSFDRKTIRTVCDLEADTQYGVWMNHDMPQHRFVSLAGLPLEPFELTFATSSDKAIADVSEALAQDADPGP